MHTYRIGDVIQCGTSIVRVHLIDGDRAWFHGTELGKSSHGGLVLGWCISRGHWPILRRGGNSISAETEAVYHQAVELFPDEPWLRQPVNVSHMLKHWLGPRGLSGF
jgi:hypothetical protein